MKKLIAAVPYVLYCGLSVRGEGYFCIIPIAFPYKFKQHFSSLQKDFARCGVIIDKSSSDISRKRFVSYDTTLYLNLHAKIYTRVSCRIPQPQKRTPQSSGSAAKEVANVIAAIRANKIDITGGYAQWWEIGCALANEFGEAGRELFHMVSQFGDYDAEITDKKFDEALKGYNFGIDTFFHYAKLCGVDAILAFEKYLE
jgi:hypothetical protein